MMASPIFTEEAIDVRESYLQEVANALHQTELTDEEIRGSIEELRDHINSYCELKVAGNVVSTDLIKASISKLGSPKTIAETLQNELDFNSEIISPLQNQNSSQFNISSSQEDKVSAIFHLRAYHFVWLFYALSWAVTGIALFFAMSGFHWDPLEAFIPVYLFYFIYTIGIPRLRIVSSNTYLQEEINQNFHLNVTPVIVFFMIFAMDNFIYGTETGLTIFAPVALAWLINITTMGGFQYFTSLFKTIRENIEN